MEYMYILVTIVVCVCTLVYYMYTRWGKQDVADYDGDGILSGYSRPLSIGEALFHDMGIKSGNYLVSAMMFTSKVTLDKSILVNTLLDLVKRHPTLHSTIRTRANPSSILEKYVFDFKTDDVLVGDMDFEFMTDVASCSDVYHSVMNSSLQNGCLWRAKIFQHECKQASDCLLDKKDELETYKYMLIFQFDHAIMDGISRLNLNAEFLRNLEKHLTNQPVEAERLPILQSSDYFQRRYALGWFKKVFFWAFLKIFGFKDKPPQPLEYVTEFCPVEVKDPSVKSRTLTRLIEIEADKMTKLRNACRQNKATIHGALSVAAANGVLHVLGVDITKSHAPIKMSTNHVLSTRKYCTPKVPPHYLGCFIAPLQLEIDFTPGGDFWKLANHVTETVHKKLANIGDIMKLFSVLPLIYDKIFAMDRPRDALRAPFVISNIGDCDPYFNGICETVKVDNVLGGMAEHEARAVLFANNILTVQGKLQWSVNYHTNTVSEVQVNQYVETIQKTLDDAIVEK